MKLIIAGSRDLKISSDFVFYILESFNLLLAPQEIVSGAAKGVDAAGEQFAKRMKNTGVLDLQIKYFPADWQTYGKKAGPIRNAKMAEYADALLLIWDGKSKGSANMKKEMESRGKPIYEVIVKAP